MLDLISQPISQGTDIIRHKTKDLVVKFYDSFAIWTRDLVYMNNLEIFQCLSLKVEFFVYLCPLVILRILASMNQH